MLSDTKTFSSDDLFNYLKILAKKFRKLNGKSTPAELYLVGGASILLNYNFREMTSDVDAIIRASSAMKDAIRQVSDEHNLPIDWLNTDFKNTTSYSPNLIKYADYRCELCNVLRIYTISAEYLVAMKLMAGRDYKHDLSDVVGIISEHNIKKSNSDKPTITLDTIKKAVVNLYGDWNKIPQNSQELIENVFQETDLESFRKKQQKQEEEALSLLKQFKEQYPNTINNSNIHSIIENLKESTSSTHINSCHYIRVESQEQAEKLKQANIPYDLKKCKDGNLIACVDKKDYEKFKEFLNKKDTKSKKL